ncbi:MAG: caspase family protein [Hyphomonas sp.]|uniref:caspase family protein n=1 Tax=Hyphomonas sp. TaxID=87 RepID=UPI0035284E00
MFPRALACLILAACLSLMARAQERYALLIGNEDYPPEVGPLALPHEDVQNMRDGLVQAGFAPEHIRVVLDATQTDINLAVARLASDLRAAGPEAVGFFYYSGHGGSAESSGQRANYLIPAKTPVTGAEQLPILGVPVNAVVDALAASDAKAVFIVSDACRNTLPFTSSKGGSADKGMVRIPRKRGLYIAFATADGATTPDDGLFSRALSKRLGQKGLSADRAFTLALREVSAARPGNALPFTADGLTEDICFAGCDAPPASGPSLPSEDADYLRTSRLNTVDAYLEFIETYPDSSFVPASQEAIVKLFYADDKTAKKYMNQDMLVGPPALLDAIFHAAETAERRDESDSATLLYFMTCTSGLGKACPRAGDLIRRGHGDDDFKKADGSDDIEGRNEAVMSMYQVGCFFQNGESCDWLRARGHPLPGGCEPEADGPLVEFCEILKEVGIPIPEPEAVIEP